MINNKRKKQRRTLHYTAWIGTGANAPLRNCAMSDISDTGAKLNIKDAEDLPEEFQLHLSGRGGIYRKCRTIWRTADQIGVLFEKAFEPPPRPKIARPASA
jgi:PilZ domain